MLHPADPNLRNVVIIAHVDHGKTTLVDAMLDCCGSLARRDEAIDCVLDSDPLERERGITIFSKNCTVTYRPPAGKHAGETYRINLIDTPRHADFGGEVERVLRMADGGSTRWARPTSALTSRGSTPPGGTGGRPWIRPRAART